MRKILFLGVFSAFVLGSCADSKKEPSPAEDTTVNTTETTQNATTETSEPVSETSSTPAGMNPPHGQPGHRCDIPVGAPLDSQPGGNVPTQAVSEPATNGQGFLNSGSQNATPTPAAQQTVAGMKGQPNPAHGQPGHRCDVQVGQPLP